MKARVFSPGQNLQIFFSIVTPDAVDVVNVFVAAELAPQFALHDEAMCKEAAPSDRRDDVAVCVRVTDGMLRPGRAVRYGRVAVSKPFSVMRSAEISCVDAARAAGDRASSRLADLRSARGAQVRVAMLTPAVIVIRAKAASRAGPFTALDCADFHEERIVA